MPPGTHHIRSSDRLAVPWRGGMHGPQPETREQIEQSFTHSAVHRREEALIERCSVACLASKGEAKCVLAFPQTQNSDYPRTTSLTLWYIYSHQHFSHMPS